MRYYVKLNKENLPVGFWGNDVFPDSDNGSRNDKIPSDAVEITEIQYSELIDRAGKARFLSGEVVDYTPPPPHIDELRTIAKKQVVEFANSIADNIYSKYAESSPSLWADFEKEARAFDQDNTNNNTPSDFPNLTASLEVSIGSEATTNAEALARLVIYVPIILTNADRFRAIALYIDGLVSRVKAQLDSAATQDEIDIVFIGAKTEAQAVAQQYGLI